MCCARQEADDAVHYQFYDEKDVAVESMPEQLEKQKCHADELAFLHDMVVHFQVLKVNHKARFMKLMIIMSVLCNAVTEAKADTGWTIKHHQWSIVVLHDEVA